MNDSANDYFSIKILFYQLINDFLSYLLQSTFKQLKLWFWYA